MSLASFDIGLVLERRAPVTRWGETAWLPHAALMPPPDVKPWTTLGVDGGAELFYAGAARVELFKSGTGNYRDNLATGAPKLWVVLRPAGPAPPVEVVLVTADPSEGESQTEAGEQVVDAVPMPPELAAALAAFVEAHHLEQPFHKRQRKRYDPEVMASRPGGRKPGSEASGRKPGSEEN